MEKRAALVTGGSGELGAAIAARLAELGYAVGVHYNARAERAASVARDIETAGGEAFTVGADLSIAEGAKVAVGAVVERCGRLDAVVNAAGGNRDGLLMLLSDADLDAVLASNLRAAMLVSRAAIRPMIERRWGRIINISSVSAWTGVAGQTHYAAAKAGLIGFTKSLAQELGKFGILVNALAPGAIDSEAVNSLPQERRSRILESIPLGRFGTPAEVAEAAAFLASEKASYITGQVLAVSGGLG